MNITLNDGKYTVVGKTNGSLEALRYGEPWRDLTGDNLVYAMACRIEALESLLLKFHEAAVMPQTPDEVAKRTQAISYENRLTLCEIAKNMKGANQL